MAAKRGSSRTEIQSPALLARPREEIRSALVSRISVGQNILVREISTPSALEAARFEYTKWNDFNVEFLRRAFTSEEYATTYKRNVGIGIMLAREPYLQEKIQDLKEAVSTKIDRLSSLAERLDLIDERPDLRNPSVALLPNPAPRPTDKTKVFLVHGQDEEAKQIVARFVGDCGLEPVILHEQTNGGRTIIEKFEKESDVGFAIVIMTPDDVGGPSYKGELASDQLRYRARQNVILELGYFVGRLGRDRVAALKKNDLELPSDFAGVVWTPMDAANAWKVSIVRELSAAGYEFDIPKALGIKI